MPKNTIQCPRSGLEPAAPVVPGDKLTDHDEATLLWGGGGGGRGTPLYGVYGKMPLNEQLLVNTTKLLKKTFAVVKLKLPNVLLVLLLDKRKQTNLKH